MTIIGQIVNSFSNKESSKPEIGSDVAEESLKNLFDSETPVLLDDLPELLKHNKSIIEEEDKTGRAPQRKLKLNARDESFFNDIKEEISKENIETSDVNVELDLSYDLTEDVSDEGKILYN